MKTPKEKELEIEKEQDIREAVRRRDNYTCYFCERRIDRGKINSLAFSIHHKVHACNGGKFNKKNLITICKFCHQKIHKIENENLKLAFNQGSLSKQKDVLKILDELENLYPEDIFLPVSKEEYTAIYNLLLKHLNIPLDIVSADLFRQARNNLKKELKSSIIGSEERK